MKTRFLKFQNKIIAFFLSVLGVGSLGIFSSCENNTRAEYGTPSATFKVLGKVTSDEGTGINGIKVKMSYDSTYTDQDGKYEVGTVDFPTDQNFQIQFTDVDGELNGEYDALDTVVVFTNPRFEGSKGAWYEGETSTEFDIKLKEKN